MALTAAEIPKGPPFVTDTDGRLVVSTTTGGGAGATAGTPADGFASPGAIPEHIAFPELYNGATWDRQRGNQEGTLLASAARTAQVQTATQTNYNARGVLLLLNVAAASGTGGLIPRIQQVDALGATYFVTAPAAITVAGAYSFYFYPGASNTVVSTVKEVDALPLARSWSVVVQVGDATSYTYSLSYALIL